MSSISTVVGGGDRAGHGHVGARFPLSFLRSFNYSKSASILSSLRLERGLLQRERVLASGQDALKERRGGDSEQEKRRLKTKIGDLTMENELLYEKIHAMEAGRPFAGRRSRR